MGAIIIEIVYGLSYLTIGFCQRELDALHLSLLNPFIEQGKEVTFLSYCHTDQLSAPVCLLSTFPLFGACTLPYWFSAMFVK